MPKVKMTHDEVLQLLKSGMDIKGFQGKNFPTWHRKVVAKWRHMWERCYDPTNPRYNDYKDVIIADEFKLFSNYLKWFKSQPRFEEFISTHNDIRWSVDKDKNGGHYLPHMMQLITGSENSKLRIKDKDNPMNNPTIRDKHYKKVKESNKRFRIPIIAINIDNNTILIFNSLSQATDKGFKKSPISKCLNGRQKSYKGYKWYYFDMNDREV